MSKKLDLERIELLPDFMAVSELEAAFRELLSMTEVDSPDGNIGLLDAYFELAERQSNTYQLLDPDLRNAVDANVIHLWDKTSLESTEILTGIVAHLGLRQTFDLMTSALEGDLPAEVRNEIEEAIRELGDTVEDPYASYGPR